MTAALAQRSGSYIDRPSPSSLADVVELILDKGLVIDAYVRVSLVGIELLTIDARIVIASVDTYLRFAEATSRLNLQEEGGGKPLDEVIGSMQQKGASGKTRGAIDGAKEKVSEFMHGSDDEDEDGGGGEGERRRPRARQSSGRQSSSRRRSRNQDEDEE